MNTSIRFIARALVRLMKLDAQETNLQQFIEFCVGK